MVVCTRARKLAQAFELDHAYTLPCKKRAKCKTQHVKLLPERDSTPADFQALPREWACASGRRCPNNHEQADCTKASRETHDSVSHKFIEATGHVSSLSSSQERSSSPTIPPLDVNSDSSLAEDSDHSSNDRNRVYQHPVEAAFKHVDDRERSMDHSDTMLASYECTEDYRKTPLGARDPLEVPDLRPAISPPSHMVTPPEFIYPHVIDPEFEANLQRAFRNSDLIQGYRIHDYGEDIAGQWKRGFTPQEVRDARVARLDQMRREWDEISPSPPRDTRRLSTNDDYRLGKEQT